MDVGEGWEGWVGFGIRGVGSDGSWCWVMKDLVLFAMWVGCDKGWDDGRE